MLKLTHPPKKDYRKIMGKPFGSILTREDDFVGADDLPGLPADQADIRELLPPVP
jgi:hypothetical protein